MPLALVCWVLSHCPASNSRPVRRACLRTVKSRLPSTTNWRPWRVPLCPAPPPVKLSRTRTVGSSENEAFWFSLWTNSNLSSENIDLLITLVLRSRSVSVTPSVR